MTRTIALMAASACAALAVTSACFAKPNDPVGPETAIAFTLEPRPAAKAFQLQLRQGERDHLGQLFELGELAGLDSARLTTGGPVRFVVRRQPGTLDCAGTAKRGAAEGSCRFAADPAFADFLAQRGIARPTFQESYHLALTGADRELVEAVDSARYPRPTLDTLTAMAAVGVTPTFIRDLAGHGYRPADLDELVQFAAVGVTPDYIAAMARAGFARLPADDLVAMRALDVSPAYVAELRGAGLGTVPAERLIELKALGVTPADVRALKAQGIANPGVEALVHHRIFHSDKASRRPAVR